MSVITVITVGALLIMSRVQAAILCDKGASSLTPSVIFQENEEEKGRY